MKALVVYESMYGNTAEIAESIGRGLQEGGFDTEVAPLDRAEPVLVAEIDLLAVGGPTHAHGMSRTATRTAALHDEKNGYEAPTASPGIRYWLHDLPHGRSRAAAFDTRLDGPKALTGSASKGIARELQRHGFDVVSRPESFLVTKANTLVEGELERAKAWGEALATLVPA
jgi:hypothetical protein